MRQWEEFANQIHAMYQTSEFIPLHEPTFGLEEKKYVMDCVESGWVSSVGKYVTQFEEKLASYLGVKRAVAVMNGTAALHIALQAIGVKEGDEVLMPALTFVATANAVSYLGATPHFVDIEESTLGIDSLRLATYLQQIGNMESGDLMNKQTGRRIKAIIPMHTFGHPVHLTELVEVCKKYGLTIVEDAAESLGSFYKGKATGSFGKVAAFSFNGNKILTTGGGGAIVTNDDSLADWMKHITTTAKQPHSWEYYHDEVGYNYRMPNLNAALGCAQLSKLEQFIMKKRELTTRYLALTKELTGIKMMEEPINCRSNYWLQTLILDQGHQRDSLLQLLNERKIMTRPVWVPMHQLPMYKECPRDQLTVTEAMQQRIINLPSTPIMKREVRL